MCAHGCIDQSVLYPENLLTVNKYQPSTPHRTPPAPEPYPEPMIQPTAPVWTVLPYQLIKCLGAVPSLWAHRPIQSQHSLLHCRSDCVRGASGAVWPQLVIGSRAIGSERALAAPARHISRQWAVSCAGSACGQRRRHWAWPERRLCGRSQVEGGRAGDGRPEILVGRQLVGSSGPQALSAATVL